MPGVSADTFITLVLDPLSVTTILTAGVDMRTPDTPPPKRPPGHMYVYQYCCVWNLFILPVTALFLFTKNVFALLNNMLFGLTGKWDKNRKEKTKKKKMKEEKKKSTGGAVRE